ncbi:hypothetical protein ACOSQ3_016004 [Xanthoceras sorbifolium]
MWVILFYFILIVLFWLCFVMDDWKIFLGCCWIFAFIVVELKLRSKLKFLFICLLMLIRFVKMSFAVISNLSLSGVYLLLFTEI